MSQSRNSAARRAGLSDGFTLIEVLVALAIVGMSLPVLYHSLQRGLYGGALVDAYGTAALLAESQLANLRAAAPLAATELEGRFANGFSWHALVRPYRDETMGEDLPLRLFEVAVTVRFDAQRPNRAVTLTTIRMEPLP